MRLAPASGSLWTPRSLSVLEWKSDQMAAGYMEKFDTVQGHEAEAFELEWLWKRVSAGNGCTTDKPILARLTQRPDQRLNLVDALRLVKP